MTDLRVSSFAACSSSREGRLSILLLIDNGDWDYDCDCMYSCNCKGITVVIANAIFCECNFIANVIA